MVFRIHEVKKYEQCPKRFFLHRQQPDAGFPYIHFAFSLSQLAKEFLNIDSSDCYVGEAYQTTQQTRDGFQDKTWLMEGRFEAKNLRAKISFLKQISSFEREEFVLLHPDSKPEEIVADYYVLCRTAHPKEEEGRRIATETWLLQECGVRVRHIYLVHLNGAYVRQGELDTSQLFCVSDHFYRDENKRGKQVSDVVSKFYHDFTDVLAGMEAILQETSVHMPYHLNCTKNGKCQFYDLCFQEDELEDNSILFLSQTRKKYDMLASGIKTMNDIDLDTFDLSYLQYAQYVSAITKQTYVDKAALRHFLSTTMEEPLSFIDFEWDTIGIPLYDGMKPYDVLVFQYSLHVYQHGQLQHHEFIQTKDCRREFIESLLAQIPTTGSVIAYHAEGAEKLRLKELAQQFPEYAVGLLRICDRMVDLTYPFMNGVVYYPKMRGAFSLKKLLSVIEPEHNYQELKINHGLLAVEMYRKLDHLEDREREVALTNLKQYCALDTYAMHVVLEDLKRLALT